MDAEDITSLAGDSADSIAIAAQKGITGIGKGLLAGAKDVIKGGGGESEQAPQSTGQVLRQQAVQQGTRLTNEGIQAVLYSLGGVPGGIYKGLRVLFGEEGALYILVGLAFASLIFMISAFYFGAELANNTGKLIEFAVNCKLSGKGDAECAAQGLLTKTAEFAKIDTCEATLERVGKENVTCDSLGTTD